MKRIVLCLFLTLAGCLQYEGALCASLNAQTRVADLPTNDVDLSTLPPLTGFSMTSNGYGQAPIAKTSDYACCQSDTRPCAVDCIQYLSTLRMVRLGRPYDMESCVHGGPVGGGWCSVIFAQDTGRVVATQHFCQD